MTKLVLFDIDGTLLRSGGMHTEAYEHMFKAVYNVDASSNEVHSSGKTDRSILYEVLLKRGFTKEQIEAKYEEARKVMAEHFRKNAYGNKHKIEEKPKVVKLLKELSKRDVVLGLCTGNLEEIGFAKVDILGIKRHFLFGGFGDHAEIRTHLVESALEKAKRFSKKKFSGKDIVIIGDTPKDIESGIPFGAKTIAVATGKYSLKELKEHHPDSLFNDFTDTEAVIAAIMSESV